MSIPVRLARFLKKHKVHYEVQIHPETFSCCDTAQVEHVSGKKIAKVVIAKTDEKDVMVVVPANRSVDLFKLTVAAGAKNARIEEEREFGYYFPDCEIGAMPPFGKLYGLPCYVDQSLAEEDEIYFNAGSHRETMKVGTQDFLKISNAELGDFSVAGSKLAA